MGVESGISFDPEQFREKIEESDEEILEELVSGSEVQIKDRLDIWREIIQAHNEEKTPLEGQVGPDIHFVLTDKEGNNVNVVERLSCEQGHSYQLDIFSGGKKIAFLRWTVMGDGPLNMGKTMVDPNFQRLGFNTLLFQHMTTLHPEKNEVWSKMSDANGIEYHEALKTGKSPVEAIHNTPAGKVRMRSGWVLDSEKSQLPAIGEDGGISGIIRPVYKKKNV